MPAVTWGTLRRKEQHLLCLLPRPWHGGARATAESGGGLEGYGEARDGSGVARRKRAADHVPIQGMSLLHSPSTVPGESRRRVLVSGCQPR